MYPDDDFIVAIATNTPAQLPQTTLRPVLDLDDPAHCPQCEAEWKGNKGSF